MIAKPICAKCQLFFTPKRNGTVALEGMPHGPGSGEPGTASPESWLPYKLWMGNLWECRGCGAQVLTTNSRHFSEHFMQEFSSLREHYEKLGLLVRVNDC